MKYAKHRSQLGKRSKKQTSGNRLWLWILLGIGVVFVIGMIARGSSKPEPVEEALEEAMEEIVEEKSDADPEIASDDTEQIVLEYIGSEGTGSGVARRGTSGDLFTHVVVAELPAIDTSAYFYEGWLVKPGVTQFFSTGDMFPRADGKWGLVWEENLDDARDDLLDYSKVVITLEPRDGDPAPAPEHVLEGEF